jgi:hypothetical protein
VAGHRRLVMGYGGMRCGSSSGGVCGYRSGSVGGGVGRPRRGGQRAGRHGEVQRGRTVATEGFGARQPRPARTACSARTAPGSALSAPGAASRWGVNTTACGPLRCARGRGVRRHYGPVWARSTGSLYSDHAGFLGAVVSDHPVACREREGRLLARHPASRHGKPAGLVGAGAWPLRLGPRDSSGTCSRRTWPRRR